MAEPVFIGHSVSLYLCLSIYFSSGLKVLFAPTRRGTGSLDGEGETNKYSDSSPTFAVASLVLDSSIQGRGY